MQAVVRAEIAQADGTGSTREPGEAACNCGRTVSVT